MNTKQWLDKILWDTNIEEDKCSLTYIDFGKEVKIPFDAIITRDSFSFKINHQGKLSTIPNHRIRKIYYKDKMIFTRRCD